MLYNADVLKEVLGIVGFLLFCAINLVVMRRYMRRRKEFNRALDLVVENIVDLQFDEQAMAEKDRFVRAKNFVLHALTPAPKGNVAAARRKADRRHWLQLQVNHLLRDQWVRFQFECDAQKDAREKLKNLAARKPGSMTNSAVDRLHSDLVVATGKVETQKQLFWDLHAAVAAIGLKVWDGGSFYTLLDPDEKCAYAYAA